MPVPAGRGGGHHDRLGIDHLAHHPTGAVGGRHQYRAQPQLLRRHPLQAAEQHVGGRVRAGERHPEPTEQGAEHRVEDACGGKRQAHGRVQPRVAREEAQREHCDDGDQRIAHHPQRA